MVDDNEKHKNLLRVLTVIAVIDSDLILCYIMITTIVNVDCSDRVGTKIPKRLFLSVNICYKSRYFIRRFVLELFMIDKMNYPYFSHSGIFSN